MKKALVFGIIAATFTLSGCKQIVDASNYVTGQVQVEQKKQTDRTVAQFKCQELCQQTLSSDEQDFSSGPCLSNEIITDWACDVVHSPRQPIDDDPRNGCSSFREGKTHHFVEVDGNCNLIKTY